MIIYPSVKRNTHAPVAQLDRVTDYESVGQGFESLPAYQKIQIPIRVSGFFYTRVDTFLARGRVPRTPDASRRDVDGIREEISDSAEITGDCHTSVRTGSQ